VMEVFKYLNNSREQRVTDGKEKGFAV
jgi:hypothetical protein